MQIRPKAFAMILIAVALVSCGQDPLPAPTPAASSTRQAAATPRPEITTPPATTPVGAMTATPDVSATPAQPPTATIMPDPGLPVGTTAISPIDGMVMAYIPAGSFTMGSDSGDLPDEAPAHRVTLHAFWMDTTEVTLARYIECVDAGKCSAPITFASATRPDYYGNSQFDTYPVIYVRWGQAASYCQWAGRRLPSEAEWEYAARGGLEGMAYPWGNEVDASKANFCDANCRSDMSDKGMSDRFTETAPVRSFPPNNYGLYDMAGNVAEWVNDWHGSYPSGSVIDPPGPTSGEYGVVRGGSWDLPFVFLSVTRRSPIAHESHGSWIGFRCASDRP